MRVFAGLLLLGFAAMPSAPARAGDDVPPSPAPPAAPAADPAADEAAPDEAPAKGSLVITVKAPDGLPIDADVEIDHKPMGNVEDGELTLVNIPAGSHAVVILAQGYQRFEHAVVVRGGEEAKL